MGCVWNEVFCVREKGLNKLRDSDMGLSGIEMKYSVGQGLTEEEPL